MEGIFLILFMFFVVFLIGILGTIFWLWMRIDCAMNEPAEGNGKLIWILVILFAHFLGAAIYFLARRPDRIRRFGK